MDGQVVANTATISTRGGPRPSCRGVVDQAGYVSAAAHGGQGACAKQLNLRPRAGPGTGEGWIRVGVVVCGSCPTTNFSLRPRGVAHGVA